MKLNFSNLGWVVALLMLGVMAGSGFQAPTLKFGNVDVDKAVHDSDFWKANDATFMTFLGKRRDLLTYLQSYRMMGSDEVTKLHDLWLKDNPTPEEKTELDRIKAQAVTEQKRQQELAVKENETPAERTEYQQFATHEQANNQILQKYNEDFTNDVDTFQNNMKGQAVDKAILAVKSLGSAQGYTLIFSGPAAAIYSGNDLTGDVTKAMNAQK